MPAPVAAIDFGATNTDVVVREGVHERHWVVPSVGRPDEARVRYALGPGGLVPADVAWIAVTGGDRSALPARIDGRPVHGVPEVRAIGRGGLSLAGVTRAVVASAGSGTAVVRAEGPDAAHVTGTGVGGGTLLGLGRLLLECADPVELDRLAATGDATVLNLTIGEIIGGAIGPLPADTTAVNFGRAARHAVSPRREDLAAAIVNLVAQVIGVIAINAGKAQQMTDVVVVGHLTDLPTVRTTLAQVGRFYSTTLMVPPDAGRATALGALLVARDTAA